MFSAQFALEKNANNSDQTRRPTKGVKRNAAGLTMIDLIESHQTERKAAIVLQEIHQSVSTTWKYS
jgi:hypothetical protein